jgi:Tol biopolymer transport system component/DNA-binding winged helix-turn-helix (wHTH) protein
MPVSVPSPPARLRLGKFELDRSSGELHNNGHKISLSPKAFELLCAIVERPGEVITREELRARLWASDTFVEFDDSLNHAVKRLRQALGDAAENPQFIETLPRYGYRFIGRVTPRKDRNSAPVIIEGPQEEDSRAGNDSPKQLGADFSHFDCEPDTAEIPTSQNDFEGARVRTSARWWLGATAALVIAVAVMAGMLWRQRPLPQPRIVGTRQLTHDSILKRSLVTDGNRVYFVESFWQTARLAQVSIAGGEVSVINTGTPLPDLGAISPDGSELLGTVSSDNVQERICAFSVLTGSHRRIGDLIGHDPGWALDGKLFFSRGKEIWVAEHDGTSPRKLLTTSAVPWGYQFSPDGARFMFSVFDPATFTLNLWSARLDGTDLQEILHGWGKPSAEQVTASRWTADGRYLILTTHQSNASSLWAIAQNARGVPSDAVMQLTTGPLWIHDVLPSKNGKQIFIVGTQPKGELIQVDPKRGRFIPILGGIFAGDPDYSRDDSLISYVLLPEQTLWRSRADGSERLQLTFPPMQAILPHWSPDVRRIAFVASMPGHPWRVFVIDKDGGVPQAISSSEESQTDPSWSKDGLTIAFSHNPEIAFSHPFLEGDQSYIGMFDVKSRAITRLAGSEGTIAPRWSPDGKHIAALAEDNRVLNLYDIESRKWKTLLRRQLPFGFIAWSRDGTAIYFDTLLTDRPTIYRLRVRDARLDPIVDLNSYRLYPKINLLSGLGSWGGLGPGDVPLLVRDISTSEIYAFDVDLP